MCACPKEGSRDSICVVSLAWLDPSPPARECNCDGRVSKRGGEKGLAHFIVLAARQPCMRLFIQAFWLAGCDSSALTQLHSRAGSANAWLTSN